MAAPFSPQAGDAWTDEADSSCWICLGDGAREGLDRPCRCPRLVHRTCLARWQLQQAGRSEETHCRFCCAPYGDWRQSLRQPEAAAAAATAAPPRPPTPVMAISFGGEEFRVKVYPGPEGKQLFLEQVRQLIQLEEDEEFDIEFECIAPGTGHTLHLDGLAAFDAATHCAALTAQQRVGKPAPL